MGNKNWPPMLGLKVYCFGVVESKIFQCKVGNLLYRGILILYCIPSIWENIFMHSKTRSTVSRTNIIEARYIEIRLYTIETIQILSVIKL